MQKDEHPWIQERLEESGNYSHRVGVNSLWRQPTGSTDSEEPYVTRTCENLIFSVRNVIINNLLLWNEWIDLDPDLHAGKYKYTQNTRIHTHFLIWPIKRRVFVNRENLSVVQTHTLSHTPSRSSAGLKAVTFTTWKQRETRKVSPCQTTTVLREFIVSYFNNATVFRSNSFLFFKNSNMFFLFSALSFY